MLPLPTQKVECHTCHIKAWHKATALDVFATLHTFQDVKTVPWNDISLHLMQIKTFYYYFLMSRNRIDSKQIELMFLSKCRCTKRCLTFFANSFENSQAYHLF
jgi:hypothetical protein